MDSPPSSPRLMVTPLGNPCHRSPSPIRSPPLRRQRLVLMRNPFGSSLSRLAIRSLQNPVGSAWLWYKGTLFYVSSYDANAKTTRTTTRIRGRPDLMCTTNDNRGDRPLVTTDTNDCDVATATDLQHYRHDEVTPVIRQHDRLSDTVLRFKRPLYVVTG